MWRPPRGSPRTQCHWFGTYTRSWRTMARLRRVTMAVKGQVVWAEQTKLIAGQCPSLVSLSCPLLQQERNPA